MRPLISICLLLALAGIALSQDVIKRVSEIPSGKVVKKGGIFDPRSGIEVEINPAGALRELRSPASDAEVAQSLKDLTTLTEAANEGLAILKRAADSLVQSDINEGATVLNKISDVFTRYPSALSAADEKLRAARLEAQSRGDRLKTLTRWQIIFEEAILLADRIYIDLRAKVPVLQVHLVLSRDNDPSRSPEASLGVLPGQASQNALKAFMEALQLSNKPGQVSPQDLQNALVIHFKVAAQAKYVALKTKADDLVTSYPTKVNAIIAAVEGDAKAKWESIKAHIDGVSADWIKGKTAVEAMIAFRPSTTQDFQKFIDLANEVRAVLADMENHLAAVQAEIQAAIAGIPGTVQNAANDLLALVRQVEVDAKDLLNTAIVQARDLIRAAALTLNLLDDLKEIGKTYKDTTDGVATFKNDDQTLEGLPAMRSYDELKIIVYRPNDADPTKPTRVGTPYKIYAWKPGRLDNITAVGFYPRNNSRKWGFTPILGQAYKFTMSGASFASNRMMPAIGYSLATLDDDDNGKVAIGIGAMITLLDDKIVGGYGYRTSGRGGYWYFGYRFRL